MHAPKQAVPTTGFHELYHILLWWAQHFRILHAKQPSTWAADILFAVCQITPVCTARYTPVLALHVPMCACNTTHIVKANDPFVATLVQKVEQAITHETTPACAQCGAACMTDHCLRGQGLQLAGTCSHVAISMAGGIGPFLCVCFIQIVWYFPVLRWYKHQLHKRTGLKVTRGFLSNHVHVWLGREHG